MSERTYNRENDIDTTKASATIVHREYGEVRNVKSMRRSMATIVLMLAFASTNLAQAVERKIQQLSGALTESTYPELESFIEDHVNKVIGLKITVERSGTDDGPLQASADNGQLVVYLKSTPDEPSESEIVAGKDFSYNNCSYLLDELFIVKNGGMNQGVVSYSLQRAKESAGKLDPSIKLEQIELGKKS
jgi:hypothetical protein